jgi:hypothetical protein
MTRRPMSRLVRATGAGALALALVAGLAACSVAPHGTHTTAAAGPTSPPPYAGAVSPTPQPQPSTDPALFGGTRLGRCDAVGAGVRAKGTLRVPGAKAVTASILVQFTDQQARVIGASVVEVKAKPGASTPWTASLSKAPNGTRCVVRAVSASR